MFEDPTPDTALNPAREEAFQTAPGNWRTQNLMPFTISRRAYFLAWRGALNLPSLSSLLAADTDAFLSDGIRLLWLSLQGPEALEDYRSQGVSAMQAACDAWADENLTTQDLPAVILTGLKIWNNASITRHAPDVDPDLTTESPGKPSPSRRKKPST